MGAIIITYAIAVVCYNVIDFVTLKTMLKIPNCNETFFSIYVLLCALSKILITNCYTSRLRSFTYKIRPIFQKNISYILSNVVKF